MQSDGFVALECVREKKKHEGGKVFNSKTMSPFSSHSRFSVFL